MFERYAKKVRAFCDFGYRLGQELSCCKRASCGAIIFPTDCSTVTSVGYNGPASGLLNDSCGGLEAKGRCGCAHAEANAIAKASWRLGEPCILYTTMSPCAYCAPLILNVPNVVGVIFDKPYRDQAPCRLIQSIIPTLQWPLEGPLTPENVDTLAAMRIGNVR